MSEALSGPDPKLRSVPGKAESTPTWERSNLRSALGGGDEKKTRSLEARITPSRYRAVQKIIQQRILPELETLSDVVQAGVGMVIDYSVRHGKNSEDFRRAVDLAQWEAEVDYLMDYATKMTRILDKTETTLKEAEARGQKKKFLAVFGQLKQNMGDIEDEGLSSRAKKLWVLHRETAEKFGRK